jgi:hypothetical protein
MTSAVRACAIALATAALILTAASAALPVPAPHAKAAGTAASGLAWAGYPMLPASPPRAGRAPGQLAARPGTSNITTVGSLNWAGYAVSGRRISFRSVRATFFMPYLNCAKSPGQTLSSHWVGLDGYLGRAQSVEQAGVAADCSAAGKASYHAWYEMFPLPETTAAISVRAGDSVTATVSYDPAHRTFRLAITDNTRGEHFAVNRKCPNVRVGGHRLSCPRTSAEAISEAPAISTGGHLVIAQLSDYGAVSFAGISVTDNAGRSGGLVSSRWDTAKIIELRPSSSMVLALPTPTQAAMFDNYWLAES